MANLNKSVAPFGKRDKFGYMFGDLANDFTFIFASTYVLVFYSKVMGVDTGVVGTMFLISRCVDALTDIGMGRIVDKCKPAKDGKFRPWIRRMAGPVALTSFMMYQSFLVNASMTLKIIYMFITYLLWGSVFYTSINIPYGSMASVISDNPKDRSSLSVFRSMGAVIASIVISIIAPTLIYYTDAYGNQVVDSGKFTLTAGIFSICALVFYALCYFMTTERVKPEPIVEKENDSIKKGSFWNDLKNIITNRAFLGMILSALLMVFSQMMSQSINTFLFADYFKNTKALSIFSVMAVPAMLILASISTPVCAKYGKKEVGTVCCIFSGIMYLIIGLLKIENVWIFIVASFFAMLGNQCFSMQSYALVTDVIDDQEVRNGVRNDGMIYGVYSFSRKIAQAISGGLGGWALSWIGYNSKAVVQSDAVRIGIYRLANFFPSLSYLLCAVVLFSIYPLTKKRVEENGAILSKKREAKIAATK